MKLRLRNTKAATTLSLVGALILLGGALLVAPGLLSPGDPEVSTVLPVSALPSPTWGSLPTRIPAAPTPKPSVDLLPLHRALLLGDVAEAAALWYQLVLEYPAGGGALYQAGARLAMMQGRPGVAAQRAWQAVGAAPTDARAWSLLGVILRRARQPQQAERAFAMAEKLEPALGPELFSDRWLVALSSDSAAALAELAADYQVRYPDSVWLPYYRAEALIAADAPLDAIQLLVPVLAERPTSPALLWYTLGRAYLASGGYPEAATALEAAASLTYRGDTSINRISNDALRDLNAALGRSYLGINRCREAETIFRRLQDADSSLSSLIEAAVICQTPTPTLTPWIPRQIGTVTPRP